MMAARTATGATPHPLGLTPFGDGNNGSHRPLILSNDKEEAKEDANGGRPSFAKILSDARQPLFRPGGRIGMHQLHDWSGLNVGDNALEIASEVGQTGGMALAHRFGCHITLTNNSSTHFVEAHRFAEQQGLAREQWKIKILDMIDVDSEFSNEGNSDKQFDCAIVEQAVLSSCSHSDKRLILQGIARHSRQILLHEYCILQEAKRAKEDNDDLVDVLQMQADLSHVLGQEMHLMFPTEWKQLLCSVVPNLQVTQFQTGPVRLWNPTTIFEEEDGLAGGLNNAIRTMWNIATHEELRLRVQEFQDVLDNYKQHIGYCLIQARCS